MNINDILNKVEYLSKINYNIDFDDIQILTQIKIDNNYFGRLDKIINKYYKGQMEFLPLLLDYNGISDITNMQLGQIIYVPDFYSYIEEIIEIDILDNNDSCFMLANIDVNNRVTNSVNNSKLNLYNEIVSANKLKISKKAVEYNETSGKILF